MTCGQYVTYLIILLTNVFAIDEDYFYDDSQIRSLRLLEAQDINLKKIGCQLRCGSDSGLIIRNECYCFNVYPTDNKDLSGLRGESSSPSGEEIVEVVLVPTYNSNISPELNRPILRHHIAHFCPNLTVARECIKKCIKKSQPAFCGKDHVCYCGHKYSEYDDNNQTDVQDYNQFKDLYQKYFGDNED